MLTYKSRSRMRHPQKIGVLEKFILKIGDNAFKVVLLGGGRCERDDPLRFSKIAFSLETSSTFWVLLNLKIIENSAPARDNSFF